MKVPFYFIRPNKTAQPHELPVNIIIVATTSQILAVK
jgi:hypothetical protein